MIYFQWLTKFSLLPKVGVASLRPRAQNFVFRQIKNFTLKLLKTRHSLSPTDGQTADRHTSIIDPPSPPPKSRLPKKIIFSFIYLFFYLFFFFPEITTSSIILNESKLLS